MPGPFDTDSAKPGVAGMSPAPRRVMVGSPQSSAPGFQDARPAAQVLAHPFQGYDYSGHPEAGKIAAGFQQQGVRRAGAAMGHPFMGVLAASLIGAINKPGVKAEAPAQGQAPPAGNVGVPNAYAPQQAQPTNLPERGKAYPADQKFDIPAGWGQGYIEQNGQRIYTYSTPQEQAARDARDQAYRHQQFDNERHGMMRDLHGEMMALVHGTGPNGGLPFEQRAAMAQALGQHLGGLMNVDVHGHNAELEHGNDPRRNPDLVAAQIAGMRAEAQRHLAEADAANPMHKIELLNRINSDANLRSLALALGGADPQTINSMPPILTGQPGVQGQAPQVHAGNIGQALQLPQNQALGAILADPNLAFHEKFIRASQIPGFNDRNSQTRQAFDTWVHQQYPTRQKWQEHVESYPVIGPDQWKTPVPLGPLKEWIGGPIMSIPGYLSGNPTGTGFGWRRNYENGRDLFEAMDKSGWSY